VAAHPPRSTPARTLIAVAGWLTAAVVATLIGVGALRLVGESIAGTPGGVLSQEEVDRQLATATAASGSPSPSPPPASPSTSVPAPSIGASHARQVFKARGGSAVAECDGTAARLVSYWPAQGYGTHEVREGPAAEAEVDFRGSAGRSKIKVRCAAGQPVAEYDED
jgi:hypothetical protein